MGDRVLKLALALTLVVAACGGGDDVSDELEDVLNEAIEQSQNDNDGGDDGGGSSGGGSGTATASLNGTNYQMVVTDPCVLMDIGIGGVAEGDGARLEVAGLPGAATVGFTVDDVTYFSAGAAVTPDGNTMSWEGEVGGGAAGTMLSFSMTCSETVGLTG